MMNDKKIFDDILNECIEEIISGEGSLKTCLQKHPQYASILEPLLITSTQLNETISTQPDISAKERVRYKLQLEMAKIDKPNRAPVFSWFPKWAMAVMSVMTVFVIGGGTVLAANSSMPGNFLYPVKIATENARVSLTSSPENKSALYEQYADRRINELNYMADNTRYDTAQIEKIADNYVYNITQFNTLSAGGAEQIASVRSEMMATTGKSGEISPECVDAFGVTPTPENVEIDGQTGEALVTSDPEENDITISMSPPKAANSGDTNTLDTENDNKISVPASVYNIGVTHVETLQKLLDTVPEEAKAAILRMIEEAKSVYP